MWIFLTSLTAMFTDEAGALHSDVQGGPN